MATYNILTDVLPDVYEPGDIIVCPYSGSIQELSLGAGTYQLECWGGKGGNYNNLTSYLEYIGANGGYTTGIYSFYTDDILYLVSGGMGSSGPSASGGYNGGGSVGKGNGRGGSGGGATHIALQTGLLSTLSSSIDSILIVAGGGGGGHGKNRTNVYAGKGGGLVGEDALSPNGLVFAGGGTQTSGGSGSNPSSTHPGQDGSFGQGGDVSTTTNGYLASGAGGGGFYGGGGGHNPPAGSDESYTSGGGGGSGYISPLLIDALTTQEETSTNPDTTQNGYIRITVINSLASKKINIQKNGRLSAHTLYEY